MSVEADDLHSDLLENERLEKASSVRELDEHVVSARKLYLYDETEMVGHRHATNRKCGHFLPEVWGCLNIDAHDLVTVYGENGRGKAVISRVRASCDKPSCEICYVMWSLREGGAIEGRLLELSKMWGQVEAGTVSFPVEDYGLSFDEMFRKGFEVASEVGILGACWVLHPARYNEATGYYKSYHLHFLGFIAGGYSRCRHCGDCLAKSKGCLECDGFEGRVRRMNKVNRYIVKVFGERPPNHVHATAVYELRHSGFKAESKRANVVRWSGVCSGRKLKVYTKRFRRVCKICGSPFVKAKCLCSRKLPEVDGVFMFDFYDEFGAPRFREVGAGYCGG